MPFQITGRALAAMLVFMAVSVLIGSWTASGGWRALATRFPAPATLPPDLKQFRAASLRWISGGLGSAASYRGCVIVGLSRKGISLSLWLPIRLFHPPIMIPWSAVETCTPDLTPWGASCRITLRGGDGFQLLGPVAEAIPLLIRDNALLAS